MFPPPLFLSLLYSFSCSWVHAKHEMRISLMYITYLGCRLEIHYKPLVYESVDSQPGAFHSVFHTQ